MKKYVKFEWSVGLALWTVFFFTAFFGGPAAGVLGAVGDHGMAEIRGDGVVGRHLIGKHRHQDQCDRRNQQQHEALTPTARRFLQCARDVVGG